MIYCPRENLPRIFFKKILVFRCTFFGVPIDFFKKICYYIITEINTAAQTGRKAEGHEHRQNQIIGIPVNRIRDPSHFSDIIGINRTPGKNEGTGVNKDRRININTTGIHRQNQRMKGRTINHVKRNTNQESKEGQKSIREF